MASPHPALLQTVSAAIAARAHAVPGLLVAGICGAQGSGKSTLAKALAADLAGRGLPAAVLSLDDVYLTRAQRAVLARKVHPLLATRGVPGTHDLTLAWQVITALERGEPAPLPRFDKLADDRCPPALWDHAPARTRVLLLEGWCIGAVPQNGDALVRPVNALERGEDPDGTWRRYVNHALTGDYQRLFARLDLLALLAAPDFEIVARWRLEQERAAGGTMDRAATERFVAHYERLTRHILAEMPARADITAHLDARRIPLSVAVRERPGAPPQTTG